MPNKPRRHKRSGARRMATDRSNPPLRPDSVKDLLAHLTPALTRVADQSARQRFWRAFLEKRLPPALLPRLSGIVERDDTLVIFGESAAWSARLRYVVQELEAEIRAQQPGIQQVQVRVLPKSE